MRVLSFAPIAILWLHLFSCQGRSFNVDHSNEIAVEYKVLGRPALIVRGKDGDQLNEFKLGQVSGLAASTKNPNILHVFHRGPREWTQDSFPDGLHFDQTSFGPIKDNVLLTVDTRTGLIIDRMGNSTFFMPHGLSSDRDGNLWLTDVALHQVFKYSNGRMEMTLGERFVPGNDEKHFCKPTDVAVSNDGEKIFVADGYCNSRVVVLDSKGNFVRQYSTGENEDQLVVPHSLTLIEHLNLLCVADRENQRIVCFNAGLDLNNEQDEGQVQVIIKHPAMSSVYAVEFDPNKKRLYALSHGDESRPSIGLTFSAEAKSFGRLIKTWSNNQAMIEPHDLTLNMNGENLFVAETRPHRIDSFRVVN